MSQQPQDNDNLKHGVPGAGSSWLEQYGHVSSELKRGRPNNHLNRTSFNSSRAKPSLWPSTRVTFAWLPHIIVHAYELAYQLLGFEYNVVLLSKESSCLFLEALLGAQKQRQGPAAASIELLGRS